VQANGEASFFIDFNFTLLVAIGLFENWPQIYFFREFGFELVVAGFIRDGQGPCKHVIVIYVVHVKVFLPGVWVDGIQLEEVLPPLCMEVATQHPTNEADSLELEKLKIELQAVREELQSYKIKTTTLTEELQKLKGELLSSAEKSKKSDFFERCQSSDFWMKTYTSLNTCTLFESLFRALEPAVANSVHAQALSYREQLFLTK